MYLIIKAHYYIAGSARGKYEANSVFWLALILRNVCLFVSLQESGIRYFLSLKSTWLEKGQVPFSVSFSRRSFLVLTDCNACFAIPLQLPGDVWGCLRITQHLNQLQFILQEVLLFWVREANLRGHSPFCQSENKIYAIMLDRTAGNRTEMAESFVFVLFCRFFFTVN